MSNSGGGMPKPSVAAPTQPSTRASTCGVPGVHVEHGCQVAPGCWYFDHELEGVDPPSSMLHLASQARSALAFWDPHINSGDVGRLTILHPGITVQYLTLRSAVKPNNSAIAAEMKALGVRCRVSVQCRYVDTACYPASKFYITTVFHDRYLFVDDDVYAVGASVGWYGVRTGSTAIHRIDGSAAKDLIRHRFQHFWDHKFTKDLL